MVSAILPRNTFHEQIITFMTLYEHSIVLTYRDAQGMFKRVSARFVIHKVSKVFIDGQRRDAEVNAKQFSTPLSFVSYTTGRTNLAKAALQEIL